MRSMEFTSPARSEPRCVTNSQRPCPRVQRSLVSRLATCQTPGSYLDQFPLMIYCDAALIKESFFFRAAGTIDKLYFCVLRERKKYNPIVGTSFPINIPSTRISDSLNSLCLNGHWHERRDQQA